MAFAELFSIAVFVAMFAVIVSGKLHRTYAALLAAAIVGLVVLRSPGLILKSVNWETIIFLGGMMIMVGGLAESGFFRWLCLHLARIARYNTTAIFISFSVLSAFLAMFIDSITVLLFMAAITIELSRLLGFHPMPFIIAFILAANTGGAATMSGDPPNVIIGTALGYSFLDFAINTGPIAWLSFGMGLGLLYLMLRPTLAPKSAVAVVSAEPLAAMPSPQGAILDARLFKLGVGIFALTIVLLVLHGWLGMPIAVVSSIAAVLTFVAAGRKGARVIKELDWRTLLFFLGLFIVVGALEHTGVLERVAHFIGEVSGGRMTMAIMVLLWVSAFASAIVDNIPFAAAMVPVIREMSASSGLALGPLSWTLALGTDIGGNGTPIGASANVVGLGVAERAGYRTSWGYYLRLAAPATFLTVLTVHLLLWWRYG